MTSHLLWNISHFFLSNVIFKVTFKCFRSEFAVMWWKLAHLVAFTKSISSINATFSGYIFAKEAIACLLWYFYAMMTSHFYHLFYGNTPLITSWWYWLCSEYVEAVYALAWKKYNRLCYKIHMHQKVVEKSFKMSSVWFVLQKPRRSML